MNKQHELNALKEQREKLDMKIEAVETELKKGNDKWNEGHYWADPECLPLFFNSYPNEHEMEMGMVFTTEQNCRAFIEYQKAMVRLRDACRPYLTDFSKLAYIPYVDANGQAFVNGFMAIGVPKFLWVACREKAIEIAQDHIEDLKIIQNFKWEE
jgi:hypothetical protein